MLFKIAIGLLFISNFFSCSKDGIIRPYGFLNLRIEGHEEDIKWETVTGKWIDSIENADLAATSYYFDRCKIHLENITA